MCALAELVNTVDKMRGTTINVFRNCRIWFICLFTHLPEEVHSLLKALVLFQFDKQAEKLQLAFEEALQMMEAAVPDVWPQGLSNSQTPVNITAINTLLIILQHYIDICLFCVCSAHWAKLYCKQHHGFVPAAAHSCSYTASCWGPDTTKAEELCQVEAHCPHLTFFCLYVLTVRPSGNYVTNKVLVLNVCSAVIRVSIKMIEIIIQQTDRWDRWAVICHTWVIPKMAVAYLF